MECVVIDGGTTSLKAGFSGEDQPAAVLPCVVGTEMAAMASPYASLRVKKSTRRSSSGTAEPGRKSSVVGHASMTRRERLNLTFPIKRGVVDDWDAMQQVWDHVYENELEVEPDSMPALLSETPLGPRKDRETMAQIFFEHFHVPGLSIACKSVLSLFATGRTTGTVLGLGAGVSSSVPVFEGFALAHATKRQDFAGEDITALLRQSLSMDLPHDIVQNIKETVCAVSPEPYLPREAGLESKRNMKGTKGGRPGSLASNPGDHRAEDAGASSLVAYELPDGQIVEISRDCQYSAPEALLQPGIGSESVVAVPSMVLESVSMCDKTLQTDLFGSVVLAGGSSMFPGLAGRVERELQAQASNPVQVVPDSQRKFAAWIGGSMFASLETFPQIFISRAEWEEHGARMVHRKCM